MLVMFRAATVHFFQEPADAVPDLKWPSEMKGRCSRITNEW
jgi:hypothetical protein